MTLEEGIIMAIVLNGIVLPLLLFAYYKGFKDYDDKKRKEEEDAKKPKPWQY
jgi:hypothetical protein